MKIRFILDANQWHGSATETVWAEPIDERRFRITNNPFYAFGVSWGDIVFAKPESEGIFSFDGVSLRGGHSTYRIISSKSVDATTLEEYWQPLQDLGCSYEGGDGRLRSIDVPPNVDIDRVYELLEHGERDGVWGFEEGYCAHALPRSP